MTLLLVRHAVALARRRWDDDDALRPLTNRGGRQARALVDQLASYPIETIWSSPAVRCVETITPLAMAHDLSVERTPLLFEGSGLAGLGLAEADGHVVLCGHGDNLPEILLELAGHLDSVPPEPPFAKGATWVLDRQGHKVVAARYLEPPA